jgi:hypothetical protein
MVYKTLHSEQLEDTKGIIWSQKPNNGLQNTTQWTVWRYQRDNQKPQDKQWSTKHYTVNSLKIPKGYSEVTRQTMVYKTLHREQFEDTKGIIRNHKKNNDLQNTTLDHCLSCGFWLSLWYLQTVHCVVFCRPLFFLWFLIIPLVSSNCSLCSVL